MVVWKSSPLATFAALLLTSITGISQIDAVASAGFSPGVDLFGRLDQLPLPLPHPGRRRGGRLAETMSDALDELRETRVELTALREEMRSMSEQRKIAMASSTTSGGAGAAAAASTPEESSVMSQLKDEDDVKQEGDPPKLPKRQSYSLGLTPQLP
mmetsp:Transcript_456/g.799  ORF Transcript_456/g.799 Transcript_456/m.799 type:complete len:156 (-) Transcript_456:430-897(-)